MEVRDCFMIVVDVDSLFSTQNLSIVGTETVLDLQLINNTARDLFAERFFNFVLSYVVTRKGPNDRDQSIYDINKALQVE